MKKIICLLLGVVFALGMQAQNNQKQSHKFDPKRFEMEMQQFITVDAGLTPMEASRFFPLFREMQDKQRKLFDEMGTYRFTDANDDKAALRAIKKMDEIDIEIKELQQEYHLKFCKVLSPGKVLRVLKADEKFHRREFKRMARGNRH